MTRHARVPDAPARRTQGAAVVRNGHAWISREDGRAEQVAEPKASKPKPSRRWYRLTPDRPVLALLVVEGLLWLSERFGWLVWHKGFAVLTEVGCVGVAMFVMLLWLTMLTDAGVAEPQQVRYIV